jgi:squalene synthase HpnC
MFSDDLERFGPQAVQKKPLTLRQSRRYCRWLARRHYENFTVVSRLVPRRLRQHVCNLYAYCRWADDLADEVDDPKQSLALLAWWEKQLRDCYRGQTTHPVFMALSETIHKFEIPAEPLVDLLVAFRQDQRITRYESRDQLLEYCRYSANPVGRLVLYLGECYTPDRVRLSDSICTGLQLANFCQDVARDWQRDRIYLPQVICRRFGYDEEMFARGECNDAFRQLLAVHVDQAEGWLHEGQPLAAKMPLGLQVPVALFVQGGLAILKAIRRQNYDVWTSRPTVSRLEKLRLLMRCWWRLP